ncbi:FecR family protein [Bordetella petrii]|uniref:FecR family protein n=1 Tax=Bordetella petrii TaxID=94624 RepID=UPI001A971948|nr:FecR domain-containing protein [Bordetella petrii]MBO1112230.1 FecR domain-containing protein [Bordetella petrii]
MNCTSERRVREQASAWAMRLGMQALDTRGQRQLERWLAADPRHAAALADAEMVWALAGECRGLPLFAQPVPRRRTWRDRLREAGAGPGARWRLAGLAACLVLAVMWFGGGGEAAAPWLADYRTAAGEIRPLALPDGSQVLLGSDSALDLYYGRDERRVRLVRGEAVFAPAPRGAGEPRAFVVEAAGGRATALGTRFVVQREAADRAWVGVLEHSVAVALDQPPRRGAARLTLPAGRGAEYSAGQGIVATDADPRQAADWAEGYLVFRGQPLDQVLRRLADFRPGLLMLLDRQAARQPVHALFHLDNLDGAIATLCAQLQLKALQLPGMTVLY